MNLANLQDWIVSDNGLQAEIDALRVRSVRMSFDTSVQALDDRQAPLPNWRRLLLAASVLAESEDPGQQEAALMIAQAAVVFGENGVVKDAGGIVLTQLSNLRAIDLAVGRGHLESNLPSRLGLTETLLATRRILECSIALNDQTEFQGSEFQTELWRKLQDARWVSATAPTAAGKTFVILHWLLKEFESGNASLCIFLAPTRALTSEIEKALLALRAGYHIPNLRIASLPVSELGDMNAPTLLVFTQERAHLFLNTLNESAKVDITVVDEAQKLGDGMRGVILQDAIERIMRTNAAGKFVFLSPQADNPEILLEDAPKSIQTASIPNGAPTVTQNVLTAKQRPRKPTRWLLSLVGTSGETPVGEFTLHDRPDGSLKRLAFVALALGRYDQGTLVYANGAAEAEKIAHIIYDGFADPVNLDERDIDDELRDLSDFCRRYIHPQFLLVELIKRGVAFHYGNMPALLRSEIERLFKCGKIKFLVSTSTLMEGVNLSCRSIIIRGPRKGRGNVMEPQDFWNLAGRAGRWGADFYGNIICVDTDQEKVWPNGVPRKAAYPIVRETDIVLSRGDEIVNYLKNRRNLSPHELDQDIEPVAAYVLASFRRYGTSAGSPSVRRMSTEMIAKIDTAAEQALSAVELPESIITAHPGISAVAMQALLDEFRTHEGALDELLPAPPESFDAVLELQKVFKRVNGTLSREFGNDQYQVACALTSVDWMRGKRIGEMINAAIERARRNVEKKRGAEINYASVIRETMQRIEEIARFKTPKFLSVYLDVLRFHFEKTGQGNEFPNDLKFELFLEFGVSTKTLLSLMGLGLSRTSALELNEFLARSELNEQEVLAELQHGTWEKLDIPNIVKREIRETLKRRRAAVA